VASVEKRPDGKWRARYRPVPGGRQIARHFRRKIDAERWLTEQQSRVNRGDWTAPELGRITVNEWALEEDPEGSYLYKLRECVANAGQASLGRYPP
jgi:hypothetical protein